MNLSTSSGPLHPSESNSESGFMMVFAIVMIALVLIALAVAAPIVAKDLRRDKEVESEHRAEQYVRAIRLYYRKNKTYPPSIEALEGTNNVRFLRKRYVDPLTGKDDWRIIRVGQNKTTVKGFFGQPLGGLNTTGAGGSLGSASTLGTGFGGAASPGSNPSSPTSTTVSGGSALSAGFSGATIGGSSAGTPSSPTTSSSSDSSTGVGQIMGVGTSRTGDSILTPNGQTTYETWEFIYDPKIELMYQQANILGGAAGGTLNSQSPSTFGSNAATGQSNSTGNSNSNTPGASTPSPPSDNPF